MPKARVNGIDIHYIERGEGTPLLAVHGFQNSHFSFTPLFDWLSERFRVYALDLRGHGDSDKRAAPTPSRPSRTTSWAFWTRSASSGRIISVTAWAGARAPWWG